MKKTFTVNLGNRVFQIDEDAYQLLDNYLNNLKFHFNREDGAEEIVKDIESRIAELFAEKLNASKEVITIMDVEEIILRMGKPEEIDNENPADESQHEEQRHEEPRIKPIRRKLFRDPEDKMIGGVCSGFAAFTGTDVIAIRLITIILAFSLVGSLFFVYLICWAIIPLARTTADKLAMRGLEDNLENIGRTVTDEANRNSSQDSNKLEKTSTEKFLSTIFQVIAVLFKIILAIIIICSAPFLFFVLITCIALLFAGGEAVMAIPTFIIHSFPDFPCDLTLMPPGNIILLAITSILIILLPILGLIYTIMHHTGRNNAIPTITKVVLLILWLAATGFWIYSIYSCNPYY